MPLLALDRINDHLMRRLGVTRRQVFERVERAALASLSGETTNSPNGVWSVSRPIITSSSKASFIPSPMPSFASRSILEQRRAPSRSFTAASASPSISAAMAAVVMEPTQITCPVPTGDTLSGYQIALGAGRIHRSKHAARISPLHTTAFPGCSPRSRLQGVTGDTAESPNLSPRPTC